MQALQASQQHPRSLDVPLSLIKDPHSWTIEDVGIWLHWLGIPEHIQAFAHHEVDGARLLQLSADGAWGDLGVTNAAQKRVLDSAIEPLRSFQDAQDQGDASDVLAIRAVEGPQAGEVFFIGPSGATGGRHSASNAIVMSENYVSRRHFCIARLDHSGTFTLQDVGSTTGTFLMVREPLELEDAMFLQLGTSEISVHCDGAQCTLAVSDGPDRAARATVTLNQPSMSIGRDPSNGLCIRDPQISSYHAEVRPISENGVFTLDDKYSTNRTWLRLAPDGRPSAKHPLRVGDLFKVGSTLFMVTEHPVLNGAGPAPAVSSSAVPTVLTDVSDADASESILPAEEPERPELRMAMEGEFRPVLSKEEYAQKVNASRLRMREEAAEQASRGRAPPLSQRFGEVEMRERDLSSMQLRMRNAKAQTAYATQGGEDTPEGRRDEDVCKICYDGDIDVVLYPCGHFVLCRRCAQKVSDCPVCRFVITDIIRTYRS